MDTKHTEMIGINKTRPLFIAYIIFVLAQLVVLSICELLNLPNVLIASNCIMGGLLVIYIICTSVVAFLLKKKISKVCINDSQVTQTFLFKLTRYAFTLDIFLTSIVVTLIIGLIVVHDCWSYLVIVYILKVEEFGALMCFILFFNKKKPETPNTTYSLHNYSFTVDNSTMS